MASQGTNPMSETSSSAAENSAERPNDEAQLVEAPTDVSNLTEKSDDAEVSENVEAAIAQDGLQSTKNPVEIHESSAGESKAMLVSQEGSDASLTSDTSDNEVKKTNKEDSSQPSASTHKVSSASCAIGEISQDSSQISVATDDIGVSGIEARKETDIAQDNLGTSSCTNEAIDTNAEGGKEHLIKDHSQPAVVKNETNTVDTAEGKENAIVQDNSQPSIAAPAGSSTCVTEGGNKDTVQDNSRPSKATADINTITEGEEKETCNSPQSSTVEVDISGVVSDGKSETVGSVSRLPLSESPKREVNEENVEVPEAAAGSSVGAGSGKREAKGKTDVHQRKPDKIVETLKCLSINELERAFLAALGGPHTTVAGTTGTAEVDSESVSTAVPAIKVTDVTGGEKDIKETGECKTNASAAEGESSTGADVLQSEVGPGNDHADQQRASASGTSSSPAKKQEAVISDEGRKPLFYVSSSELPPEIKNQPSMNPSRSRAQRQDSEESTSCLGSKRVHGTIFLAATFIAFVGFAVYSLAQKGKVPEVFQPIGLSTAVIAGIIGIFSCLYFSFSGCFPTVPFSGHEMIGDAETVLSMNQFFQPQNTEEKSWSSEAERAFRRPNGMTSARTNQRGVEAQSSGHLSAERAQKLKMDLEDILERLGNADSKKKRKVEEWMKTQPVNDSVDRSNGSSEVSSVDVVVHASDVV